jgi:hypothetical protein
VSEGWTAPLPDLSRPAISKRVRIGGYTFQLLVSDVLVDPPGEPETDLVQLMVLLDGRPLTLHDLGAETARCSTLWAFLCSRLTEVTVDFYDPRPRPNQELNPRLGCWGTRPDLLADAREDDCSLAVVAGISTWRTGARPRGSSDDYVRELAEALAEVLAYWVLTVERDRRAGGDDHPHTRGVHS